jgi:hypothetical protein
MVDDDEAGTGLFDLKPQLFDFSLPEQSGRARRGNRDDAGAGDFQIDRFGEAGRFREAIMG